MEAHRESQLSAACRSGSLHDLFLLCPEPLTSSESSDSNKRSSPIMSAMQCWSNLKELPAREDALVNLGGIMGLHLRLGFLECSLRLSPGRDRFAKLEARACGSPSCSCWMQSQTWPLKLDTCPKDTIFKSSAWPLQRKANPSDVCVDLKCKAARGVPAWSQRAAAEVLEASGASSATLQDAQGCPYSGDLRLVVLGCTWVVLTATSHVFRVGCLVRYRNP